MNIEAMSPDMIVPVSSGACHLLSRICQPRIINAGDGLHEHPTQALLDAFIREHKQRIEGLVAIIGDLMHSRVLRSNILLLTVRRRGERAGYARAGWHRGLGVRVSTSVEVGRRGR
jgi:aspartate carbamoyltransferase catalytic subunit